MKITRSVGQNYYGECIKAELVRLQLYSFCQYVAAYENGATVIWFKGGNELGKYNSNALLTFLSALNHKEALSISCAAVLRAFFAWGVSNA